MRRGGTLVTVRAGEEQSFPRDRGHEPLQPRWTLTSEPGEWQSSGWSGFDADAGPYSTRTRRAATHQAVAGAGKPSTKDPSQSPDYRAQTGMTGENCGGTYEGAGSAGYTGSGTTYQGSGSFTSNTEPSGSDSGTVYGGGDSYTNDMDKPNRSDKPASPVPGSSTAADEDSVMSSGHGEMSTSQGFSGQGGGTYERMRRKQDADPTVHPRSSEGDYQARRDFLGGESRR